MTVTLTSAVETLPGGALLTTVTMGVGVGTATSGTTSCSLLAPISPIAPGQTVSGTLGNGAYCVVVSDVSNQLGPVSYAVAVNHP